MVTAVPSAVTDPVTGRSSPTGCDFSIATSQVPAGELVAGVVDDDDLLPRISVRGRFDVVHDDIATGDGSPDIAVDRLPTGHAETGMVAPQYNGFLEVVENVLVLDPQTPMDRIDRVRDVIAVGGLVPIGQAIFVPQKFIALANQGDSL